MSENKVGRKTVMTDEVISKLEHIYSLDGTDEEACAFANISEATLYNYQKENQEFIERKNSLKQKPFLKARETIVGGLGEPEFALKYMERKKKKEFAQRTELTGEEGKELIKLELTDEQKKKIADEFISNGTNRPAGN